MLHCNKTRHNVTCSNLRTMHAFTATAYATDDRLFARCRTHGTSFTQTQNIDSHAAAACMAIYILWHWCTLMSSRWSRRLSLLWTHFTLTSVCVRALPVCHYWSQTNRRGVVAELLDTVAKHRFV